LLFHILKIFADNLKVYKELGCGCDSQSYCICRTVVRDPWLK